MSEDKLPAIMLYVGDWLRDAIAGCSLAAQGLWLRMMFVMHDSDRYGHLAAAGRPFSDEAVAARCGCSLDEYKSRLRELLDAGVPSCLSGGILFSRRMVRDAELRKARQKSGRLGGKQKSRKALAKVYQNTEDETEDENEDKDVSVSVVVPEDLKANLAEIQDWLAYKRERGQGYKPRGMAALWRQLRQVPQAQRKAAIEFSMASNYAGIYPPKGGQVGKNKSSVGHSESFVPTKPVIKLGGGAE